LEQGPVWMPLSAVERTEQPGGCGPPCLHGPGYQTDYLGVAAQGGQVDHCLL
jgi:hypothetical protein